MNSDYVKVYRFTANKNRKIVIDDVPGYVRADTIIYFGMHSILELPTEFWFVKTESNAYVVDDDTYDDLLKRLLHTHSMHPQS